MEPKKNADLLALYRPERIFLGVLGYYPIAKGKHTFLQTIPAVIITGMHLIYFTLGIVFAALNVSDVRVFSSTCAFVLTDLALLMKLLNIIHQKDTLLKLEEMLQNPMFTEIEGDEETTLKQNLRTSRTIEVFSTVLILFNMVFQLLYPFVYNQFFLLMWFPFNPMDYFYSIYCFESFLHMTGASADLAADVMCIILLDICSSQLLLLKDRLLKIGTTSTGFENVDNKQRVELLKKYIDHHSYIYNLCSLVEESLTVGMFFQISASAAILCFSSFLVLLTPVKSVAFGMSILYAAYMLWELSTYFYLGQKVLDCSSTISEACYASKWYDCSVEVQKYLLVILTRASEPVNISACGIFTLNFETYMTILSTAYSFFTLVWKIYTEN